MQLALEPIGYVRAVFRERCRAPRQPGIDSAGIESKIELVPGHNFEQALEDLEGIERIWVLSWFDRNPNWKTKVLPPRGPRIRRSVFATRSPHRPNPIGLSLVRLLAVNGRVLHVAELDLLDGTPIVDIKPYLPAVEAHPTSRSGWIESIADWENTKNPFEVNWSDLAAEQANWLAERHDVEIRTLADRVLAHDPAPHREYRRVMIAEEGGFRLAVKSWRVRFDVVSRDVNVTCIESGYPKRSVLESPVGSLEDDSAHREFFARWG